MNLGLQTVSDDHYVNHQFPLSIAIDESNDILSSSIYGSSPSRYDEVVPHETNHSVLKREK